MKRAKVTRRAASGAKRVQAEIDAIKRTLLEKEKVLEAIRVAEAAGYRVLQSKTAKRRAGLKNWDKKLMRVAEKLDSEAARLTWSAEMRRVLGEQDAGISYSDLLAILVNGDLGKHRSTGDKGFYQAIRRLTAAGELVKSGNLLYSAELAKTLKANGEALPVRSAERGGAGSIVLGILDQNPRGLSAPELKEKAGNHPDAPKSIRAHPHYIYNVLRKLAKAGKVTKEGYKYRRTAETAVVH